MYTNKHLSLKHFLSLSTFAIINNGCVSITVPDSTPCHVQGFFSDGHTSCAHTNTTTDVVFSLTFKETVDLLEAHPARHCVPINASLNVCKESPAPSDLAVDLPARGASVIIEDDQYTKNMEALEMACRAMGSHCAYSVVKFLKSQGFMKQSGE